jgi:anti-sigma regulatory factor (Ser/Thr protein kinase)
MKRKRKFEESISSVPLARRFVADSLATIASELSETASLLVSELATNAIVHAGSAFAVTVVHPTPSGRIHIEVTDRDGTRPSPTRPPPNVPHGRGLLLVATLADEWGVREPRRRAGKAVWFELTPQASPARNIAGALRRRSRRAPGGLRSLFAVGLPTSQPTRRPAPQFRSV